MSMNVLDCLNTASQVIFDKKGFNILALDVRGISTMTDFFLIAEGTVDRHVKAIGQAVEGKLSECNREPLHVEGGKTGDWLVIDYGEIVIHLFVSGLREKYALESLWHEGKIIDLAIDVSKTSKEEAV